MPYNNRRYRRYKGKRSFRFRQMSQGQKAMSILGAMVGLVLGLWVYSQVLDIIIPLLYSCVDTWVKNSTDMSNIICQNASNMSQTADATLSFFSSTIAFIISIIPVLGVVAAYKTAKPLFTGF